MRLNRAFAGLLVLASPVPANSALAQAKPEAGTTALQPWQLERSTVLSLRAADGHAYRVMVAWPDGPPPPGGWPVLWVLDGEDNFAIAALTSRRLAGAGARGGVDQGLVVAVESGSLARRVLDYTPASPGWSIPARAPASGLPTGGADAFLAFLRERAMPAIAARWSCNSARQTLMGHSFGGLLALHALAKGGPWQRYVAVSPSLWFGDGLASRELAQARIPASTRLFLAGGDAEGAPRPSGGQTDLPRLAAELTQRGVDTKLRILPGIGHGGTMLAAMTDAITTAFSPQTPKERP